MSDERCGSGGIFLAFLAGGLIGAGLALLYAPAAGDDTRKKICDMAEDMKKKSERWSSEMKQRMENIVNEERAVLKAAYDAGRNAMEREKTKFEGTPEA
ncbi:MAG: YtxH domain-containing protein [Syntrophorhabdaceae bacterium]|nr:YtxH domain-containing protein [Syntrophorhabdaceae bacterium]